ncbi:hypothetical protein R1sor_004786 [Riccia sorocarpa]|uniref:Uncharacterized protein n=1 Tax=Riccia sorocarpa TaxID=122646 RepID=A0ABD3HLG3_9MARC
MSNSTATDRFAVKPTPSLQTTGPSMSTTAETVCWLERFLGTSNYSSSHTENSIDGEGLMFLSESKEDLEAFGFNWCHRLKLFNYFKNLRSSQSLPENAPMSFPDYFDVGSEAPQKTLSTTEKVRVKRIPSYDEVFVTKKQGKNSLSEDWPEAHKALLRDHQQIRDWFSRPEEGYEALMEDILHSNLRSHPQLKDKLYEFADKHLDKMLTLTFESEADDKTMVMKWKRCGKTRRGETDQATDCKKQKTEKVRPQDQSMGDEEDHGEHSGQHRAADILEEVKHSDEYMEAILSSSLPQSCEVQKARPARVAQKASFSDRVKNYLRSIKDSDDEEGKKTREPINHSKKQEDEDSFADLLENPQRQDSATKKTEGRDIDNSEELQDKDIHDQEPGDGDLLAELQPLYSRRKKRQEAVNLVTDARIAVETTTTSTHFTTTNSVTKSGKATSAISLQKEVPLISVENEALQRNQRTETPRRTSHRLKSKMDQSVLSTPPSPETLAAVSD